MLKKITKGAGMVLSLVSMGTMASAGSLAEGAAEPVVEDLVIEESQPTSGAWIPIALGLVAVAAVIASSSSDDSPTPEPASEDPKISPE